MPDDPVAAARAVAALGFTSHNLELAPGVQTRPGQPLLRDEVRARTLVRELRRLAARGGSLAGLRALDLGCLEGGFAVELARLGMEVVGIEGRASNFARCAPLPALLGLPNLRFEHRDVKSLDPARDGRFDVILCLGLLYHLDDPAALLERLGRDLAAPGAMMFVDTHVAPADDAALAAFEGRAALSALGQAHHAGHAYPGRWYHEYDAGAPAPDEAWTAVSNPRSWWLTEAALLRALLHGGFDRAYVLYGAFPIDEEFALRARHSRGWYLATRDPG